MEKRHAAHIENDWITVTPGVVYSIAMSIRAFTKKGDAILVQQPVYYPFMRTIEINDRKVVNSQLVLRDGHYEIDFEDFEKKIEENDVRMFILCSPHNPVGRVWTRDELMRIADICGRHQVYVYADEIHSDFTYPGHEHVSFVNIAGAQGEDVRYILGTSASKTFNLAGLQVANIVIPDEDMRKVFRKESDAVGYSQPNVLGMVATMSCYRNGEKWLDELLEYLSGNLDYIRIFLRDRLPQVKLVEPEGTYLVWLDFSEVVEDHKELEKLIVDGAHLWLDPGIIFGRETALFERINIACPRHFIEKAMEQLLDAVLNLKSEGDQETLTV
jgi:cystathionine beta-lyase